MKRLLYTTLITIYILGSYPVSVAAAYDDAHNFTASATGQVNITITPTKKNGAFNSKSKVNYKLYIKNGLPVEQEGTISYKVKDVSGAEIMNKTFDIKIPANKKMETVINIPHSTEGQFSITFNLVLNNNKSDFNFNFAFNQGKKSTIKPDAEKQKKIKYVSTEVPDPEMEGEIKTTLKPINPDGVFLEKDPIIYYLELRNTYPIAQEGTVSYQVKEATKGTVVSQKVYDVRLKKRGTQKLKIIISTPPKPGIYNIAFAINTNTYDDTTHYAFGYEIAQISSPYHRPDDFDEFWKKAMDELAAVNPSYKVEEDPEQSDIKFKVYHVEMNSLENIRINGWLTIPQTKLGGKFPVVVGYGGYQVTARPLKFEDFACFTLNTRGADRENSYDINPTREELLTLNIGDPKHYVYRGIYMDCVRAIDFLYANETMGFDVTRIALFGGSQGGSFALIVAALLNKKIKTSIVDNPTYCDYHLNLAMESQIRERSFVLEFIHNFLAANKNYTVDDLLQTLSYYEVQNFIPKIKCPVLFGVGLLDPLAPAVTTIGAFNKLNSEAMKVSEIYTFPTLAHEVPERHNTFKSTWFYEKLATGRKN